MNLSHLIAVGVGALFPLLTIAQDSTLVQSKTHQLLSSDRPGQTYSSSTVEKGAVQIQLGYTNVFSKSNYSYSQPSVIKNQLRTSTLDVRLGIISQFEVDFGVTFSSVFDKLVVKGVAPKDSNKKRLKNPILPRVSFRYHPVKELPLVIMYNKDFYIKRQANDSINFFDLANGHTFRLSSSYSFRHGTAIAANLGIHLNESGYYNSYTLNVSQSFKKWGAYFEVYGDNDPVEDYYTSRYIYPTQEEARPKVNFDLGLFFQPIKFVLLDLSYGKVKSYYKNNMVAAGITIQPSK